MMNYNELMKKLDEYGGAMVFLNGFREILSKYNLTPKLIADILERAQIMSIFSREATYIESY